MEKQEKQVNLVMHEPGQARILEFELLPASSIPVRIDITIEALPFGERRMEKRKN